MFYKQIIQNLLLFALVLTFFSCLPTEEEKQNDRNLARAKELVSSMDDASLAAQLLMVGIQGRVQLSARSQVQLHRFPVGAVMLFKYNLGAGPEAARKLADACVAEVLSSGLGIPPLVAADAEGGLVHRFGNDATRLPAPSQFAMLTEDSRLETIEEAAYLSALELRELGLSLNLAPLAEVLTDKNEAFCRRSVPAGRQGDFVASAAGAFVRGMEKAGIVCVVKHFPGSGEGDPHTKSARISASGKDLEALIHPFRQVIQKIHPEAIMVSHAIVESIDPALPGTLSAELVTGELKGRLGFKGMVLTDDLRMAAIASTGKSPAEAAVEAVAAGCDLVMTWPEDLEDVHAALLEGLRSGLLSRARLEDAGRRILMTKLRFDLVDINEDADVAKRVKPFSVETLKAYRKATKDYLYEKGFR
ncbi:glycoside hydrolase family 3 N-terminal domain-containing protein [Treponema sp.]